MRRCFVLLAVLFALYAGCDSGGGSTTTQAVPTQTPLVPPPPPGSSAAATSSANPAPADSLQLTKSEERAGFSMKTYRGKQPVLIVFNGSQDQWTQKFNDALNQQQAEVDQHRLVVIEVLDTMRAYPTAKIRGAEALSEEAATNLMESYNGGGGTFKTVLVGKDGQVLARGGYKDPKELLALLADAPAPMP